MPLSVEGTWCGEGGGGVGRAGGGWEIPLICQVKDSHVKSDLKVMLILFKR